MKIDLTVDESICLLSFINTFQSQLDSKTMLRETAALNKVKRCLTEGLNSEAI